jgi:hypothetical protein
VHQLDDDQEPLTRAHIDKLNTLPSTTRFIYNICIQLADYRYWLSVSSTKRAYRMDEVNIVCKYPHMYNTTLFEPLTPNSECRAVNPAAYGAEEDFVSLQDMES